MGTVGLLRPPPSGQRPPSGGSRGCVELSKLLGNFFCISSLRGGVALGAGIHSSADPLPFGGPEVSPLRAWDAA